MRSNSRGNWKRAISGHDSAAERQAIRTGFLRLAMKKQGDRAGAMYRTTSGAAIWW